jgi:hypothetical protein
MRTDRIAVKLAKTYFRGAGIAGDLRAVGWRFSRPPRGQRARPASCCSMPRRWPGFAAAEIAPGPERRSKAEINAYIRAAAIPAHHPLGTCKIGQPDDPAAVIDASVMADRVGRQHQRRRDHARRKGRRSDPRPHLARPAQCVSGIGRSSQRPLAQRISGLGRFDTEQFRSG